MIADPSAHAKTWARPLLGQNVGGYVLDGVIGEGGFGLVFRAYQEESGRRVAVKVLFPGSNLEAIQDFENECSLLDRLSSCKGVVNSISSGNFNAKFFDQDGNSIPPIPIRYCVMQCAEGSLDEILQQPEIRDQLSLVERLSLWRKLVIAVVQIHELEIVHRDLKSSNCLLFSNSGRTSVLLGDLGRGRDLNAKSTRSPEEYLVGRGDFRFAPPEMLFWQGGMAKRDFVAADYYGLGSVLSEIICGQPITALAIGNVREALAQGYANFRAGNRLELSSLKQKYRAVVNELVHELPKSIQVDAAMILNILCSPDPQIRFNSPSFRRDRRNPNALAWAIRRVDIMIRRLEIEESQARRRQRNSA